MYGCDCVDGCFVCRVEDLNVNKMKAMVKEWHEAFGVPINEVPTIIDIERSMLHARLIDEESNETQNAMGVNATARIDLIEVADGCADLLYVIFGACLEFGIPIEEVFAEVHRSNMSKMWTIYEWQDAVISGQVEREGLTASERDDSGKLCVKRADGKIIKSPSYSPADIKSVLVKYGAK